MASIMLSIVIVASSCFAIIVTIFFAAVILAYVIIAVTVFHCFHSCNHCHSHHLCPSYPLLLLPPKAGHHPILLVLAVIISLQADCCFDACYCCLGCPIGPWK
jgi:hypothetical protein